MKVRLKIIGALGLMIFVVSCILVLFMIIGARRIQKNGDEMLAVVNKNVEESVRRELLDLAESISNFVITLEAEIDKSMLNAAKLLQESDRLNRGRLTLADLNRLRRDSGMSDLYLGNTSGIFTLTTEPEAVGDSLFAIWDGYRMLVTGESDYLPSSMKIKAETGEIFKFTAIPRSEGRGILESALNANAIEDNLQTYVTSNNGIRSMNLFDYTLLTLTGNYASGVTPLYTKGDTASLDAGKIDELFKDSSKVQIALDQQDGRLYYPVIVDNAVRYVLFIDLDASGYFATAGLIQSSIRDLIKGSTLLNMVSLAAVFVSLLIFTIFISILISRLLQPLGFFNSMLASFSEGDLSLEVPGAMVKRGDEMGEMSQSFRHALEKMKNLITVIRSQSFSLKDIGEELASHMTRTSSAINGITENIKAMKGQTEKQASGVTETSVSVTEIMNTVGKLNEHIGVQSDNVSRSSEAIESMLKNIHQVVETLIQNTGNVAALTESSEVGRSDLQKVSTDIQEIAKESEGLLEINAVMENIANQTNLLAMNAAIEAAHAGEAGKGFAVVASEIRKLAESSAQQSKTTVVTLKKIKALIDTITQSTAVVLERFESIEREIKTVSSQEQNIRTMMEEQETGSQHVLKAIAELNNITGLVRQGSEAMAGKSAEVIRESVNLEGITKEIAGGMNDMANGAEQINDAVDRVNEICEKNKRNIGTLNGEVSKFKVE